MKLLKHISIFLSIWIGLSILFTGLSYLSTLPASEECRQNSIESLKILDEEGLYPHKFGNFILCKDNFTDMLMVDISAFESKDSIFQHSLTCPMYQFSEDYETFAQSTIAALSHTPGPPPAQSYYGRYWHGYKIILKSILNFTDIRGIRTLNYIILCILLLLTTYIAWAKFSGWVAFSFIISLLCTAFPIVPDTMQFANMHYLALLASLIILLIPKRKITPLLIQIFFFVIGALTSFFDLLTTPLLTLGFPLVFLMLRKREENLWQIFFTSCLFWGIGYGGLWATKWIITAMFTNFDIIGDAFSQVQQRGAWIMNSYTGPLTSDHVTYLREIYLGIIAIAALFLISAMILCIAPKSKKNARRALPFAAVSLLPIIWITAINNHSLEHLWFVWRIFAICIFGALIFYVGCTKRKNRLYER